VEVIVVVVVCDEIAVATEVIFFVVSVSFTVVVEVVR
jgi:hypothetical protein